MATNGSGNFMPNKDMSELHKMEEALGNEEFRKLFFQYVKELSENNGNELVGEEPAAKGLNLGLIRPEPNYVIKTTTAQGTETKDITKSFVNMCSSSLVGKPSCVAVGKAAESGIQWSIPHSVSSPRDDLDKQGEPCIVCDVIFHQDTLRFAKCNRQFRRLVEEVALDAFEKVAKNRTVDRRNLKYPQLPYKGQPRNTYLRSDNPQGCCRKDKIPSKGQPTSTSFKSDSFPETTSKTCNKEYPLVLETPKYTLKYRYYSDLQDFVAHTCLAGCGGGHRPKEMVVEIQLPRVHEAAGVKLDVKDRKLTVDSVDGKTYRLEVDLPYDTKEDDGKARFDRDKKTLTVELPVVWNRLPGEGLFKKQSEMDAVKTVMPDFTYHQDEREIIFVLKVPDVIANSVRLRNEGTQLQTLTFDAASNAKDDDDGASVRHQIVWRFPSECPLSVVGRFSISKRNVVVAFEKMVSSDMCKRFEVGSDLDHLLWEETNSIEDVAKKIQCLQDEKWTERETSNVEVVEFSDIRLSVKVESSSTSTANEVQGSQPNSASEADVAALSDAIQRIDLSNGSNKQYKTDAQLENNTAKNARENCNPGNVQGSSRKVRSYSESSTDSPMVKCRSKYPKGILKYRRLGRSLSECVDDSSWSSPEFFAGPDSDLPEESCEEGGHSLEKKSVRFSEIVSRNIFKSNLSILSQRSKNLQRLKNRRRASGKRSSESDCSENESGESATRAEKCVAENQKMKASKKRHAGKKSKGLERYAGLRNGNKLNGNKKGGSCSTSEGESDLIETPPQNNIDNNLSASAPITSKRNPRWNRNQWKNSGRKRRGSGCETDSTDPESGVSLAREAEMQEQMSGKIAFSNDLMFQLDE